MGQPTDKGMGLRKEYGAPVATERRGEGKSSWCGKCPARVPVRTGHEATPPRVPGHAPASTRRRPEPLFLLLHLGRFRGENHRLPSGDPPVHLPDVEPRLQ